MSKQNAKNSLLQIVGNLGWPVFLGLWGCGLFYVLILWGPLQSDLLTRYFAGFWISKLATGMFFVGLAALGLKLLNVASQYTSFRDIRLPAMPSTPQSPSECSGLLEDLLALPARLQKSYLGQRLIEAIESVDRKQSAANLDDELKYLADISAERQHDSYALVRILIWATPMLGFLGTVIGITQALGGLRADQLDSDFQAAMSGLLGGLYIAFDTTALALSLSIVLMFVQFLIDRLETQLLMQVDARVNEELTGRFETFGGDSDPVLASVERMSRSVLRASEHLVQKQAQLWQGTIEAAHESWARLTSESGEHLQRTLAAALDASLEKHAQAVAASSQAVANQAAQRTHGLEKAIAASANNSAVQQQELAKQTAVLTRAVEATADVVKLEQALNGNLAALAGAKNFEKTVMSLSAAIHLLTSRLSDDGDSVPKVELQSKPQERAA